MKRSKATIRTITDAFQEEDSGCHGADIEDEGESAADESLATVACCTSAFSAMMQPD